jgi:hypothetical protein
MIGLRLSTLGAVLALATIPAQAQVVLSAKSGLVNYVEGTALLADKALELQPGQFPEVKEGTVLRTVEGRVEVALTPGVMLRLGENSSFRMVTNRLVDTRLEMLTGSAVIEATEIARDTNLTIVTKGSTVVLTKGGLYRFDAEPARLKVFEGSADVQAAGQSLTVKSGKMVSLEGNVAIAEKFDSDLTDSLDRWSRRRADVVAMANVSAANRARRSYGSADPCMNTGGYGRPGVIRNYGSWGYNPYYNLMTYIPCSGMQTSPYGYRYYSPAAVYSNFFAPRPVISPNMGDFSRSPSYSTMGSTSSGYSGTIAASPSVSTSAPAAAASSSSAASSAASSSVGSSGGGGGGGRGR